MLFRMPYCDFEEMSDDEIEEVREYWQRYEVKLEECREVAKYLQNYSPTKKNRSGDENRVSSEDMDSMTRNLDEGMKKTSQTSLGGVSEGGA